MPGREQDAESREEAAADGPLPLTPEEKQTIIDTFEANGFATFRLGLDREAFDTLVDYVRLNKVPTLTDIDESARTITLTKRPFGSLEFGL